MFLIFQGKDDNSLHRIEELHVLINHHVVYVRKYNVLIIFEKFKLSNPLACSLYAIISPSKNPGDQKVTSS